MLRRPVLLWQITNNFKRQLKAELHKQLRHSKQTRKEIANALLKIGCRARKDPDA